MVELKNRYIVASIISTIVSSLSWIVLLALFIMMQIYFGPVGSVNDAYSRVFFSLVKYLPAMIFICFLYFLYLRVGEATSLKIVVIVSCLLSLLFSFALYTMMQDRIHMASSPVVLASVTLYVGVGLIAGALASNKRLKTQEKHAAKRP